MMLDQLQKLKKDSSYISYVVNHTIVKIHRLKLQLDYEIEAVDYLHRSSLYPKVFWKAKNSSEITLALGSIYSVSETPSIYTTDVKDSLPRFFGGIFFDALCKESQHLWEDFSPGGFFIPRIEITLQEGKSPILYYHYLEEEKEQPILEFLHKKAPAYHPFHSNYLHRIDTPSLEQWHTLIHKALHKFETTPLNKVLLARASHCTYTQLIHPIAVLTHLIENTHHCTLFAYMLSDTEAFVGATPEHLYTREGLSISTEAVAGTRPRGTTLEEDQRLLNELMQVEKEQREFEYVPTFLNDFLASVCKHYTQDQNTSVLQTASIQHLYKKFHGVLHPLIGDLDLVGKLHPTPAIGGYPKKEALQFLASNEPFSRGHYASPLGWIAPYHTDLCVAIRSALIKKSTMTLFAGAGIVQGSHPQREWEELELKISPFLGTYGR